MMSLQLSSNTPYDNPPRPPKKTTSPLDLEPQARKALNRVLARRSWSPLVQVPGLERLSF